MGSVAHVGVKPLTRGDRVALMVNSLGATPALELGVAANAALHLAHSLHGVRPLPGLSKVKSAQLSFRFE